MDTDTFDELLEIPSMKNILCTHPQYNAFIMNAIYDTNDFDIPIDEIIIIIAVERGLSSMTYVKKIDDYVEPLLERINTFYDDIKEPQ